MMIKAISAARGMSWRFDATHGDTALAARASNGETPPTPAANASERQPGVCQWSLALTVVTVKHSWSKSNKLRSRLRWW